MKLRCQSTPPTAPKTDTDKLAICAGQTSGGCQPTLQRERCLPSAASSRTAASALQAGWIGLCRIAIYQIVNERNGGQGRIFYVTPVHVTGFGHAEKIWRNFLCVPARAPEQAEHC